MAASIIKSQSMGSITFPYPAEFLPSEHHANFRKLQAFKGRGVLLHFQWTAQIDDVPEWNTSNCRPNILYRIYMKGVTDQNGFKGEPDQYWCSRIYPTTKEGLTLKAAARALQVPHGDYSYVRDTAPVDDREIKEMNELIGGGLNIQVLPQPPNLRSDHLERSRKAIRSSVFMNFLRRFT